MKNRRTFLMKSLGACGALAAGLITCFAGTADAKLVVPGSACSEIYEASAHQVYRTANTAGTLETDTRKVRLICPVPIDHEIASPVHFSIVVDDQHTTEVIECAGNVFDAQGNANGAIAGLQSTSSPTGVQTLSGTVTTTPSTNNNYVVICELPWVEQGISTIRSVSVY